MIWNQIGGNTTRAPTTGISAELTDPPRRAGRPTKPRRQHQGTMPVSGIVTFPPTPAVGNLARARALRGPGAHPSPSPSFRPARAGGGRLGVIKMHAFRPSH